MGSRIDDCTLGDQKLSSVVPTSFVGDDEDDSSGVALPGAVTQVPRGKNCDPRLSMYYDEPWEGLVVGTTSNQHLAVSRIEKFVSRFCVRGPQGSALSVEQYVLAEAPAPRHVWNRRDR